jgi:CBS domain-containing protein
VREVASSGLNPGFAREKGARRPTIDVRVGIQNDRACIGGRGPSALSTAGHPGHSRIMTTRNETHALVEDAMESPVRTIDGRATVRAAAAALRDLDVGTLVVMAGDDIVGIISERDVVRAVADGADIDDVAVGAVMSPDPRYATTTDSIRAALNTMIAVGVRHLPVVEEGEVIGIVSMRDLVAPFID